MIKRVLGVVVTLILSFFLFACDEVNNDETFSLSFENDNVIVDLNTNYDLDALNNIIISSGYSNYILNYSVSNTNIAEIIDNTFYPKAVGRVDVTVNCDFQGEMYEDICHVEIQDNSINNCYFEQESLDVNVSNMTVDDTISIYNRFVIESDKDKHTIQTVYKNDNGEFLYDNDYVSYNYDTGEIRLIKIDKNITQIEIGVYVYTSFDEHEFYSFVLKFEYDVYSTMLGVSHTEIHSKINEPQTFKIFFDKGTTMLPSISLDDNISYKLLETGNDYQTYEIISSISGEYTISVDIPSKNNLKQTIKYFVQDKAMLNNLSINYNEAIFSNQEYILSFDSNIDLDTSKITIKDYWTFDGNTISSNIGTFVSKNDLSYSYSISFSNAGSHKIVVEYLDEYGNYSNAISLEIEFEVYELATNINTQIYNQSNTLVDTQEITLTLIDNTSEENIELAIADNLNTSCYVVAQSDVAHPFGNITYSQVGQSVSVSSVDNKYVVEPISVGTSTITFMINNVVKTITINVDMSKYSNVHLDKQEYELLPNSSQTILVEYLPQYAYDKSSSIYIEDTSIAVLEENILHYVSSGNTNIIFENKVVATINCVAIIDEVVFDKGSQSIEAIPGKQIEINCRFLCQGNAVVVPIDIVSNGVVISTSKYLDNIFQLIFYVSSQETSYITLVNKDTNNDIITIDIVTKPEIITNLDVTYEDVLIYQEGLIFEPQVTVTSNYGVVDSSRVTMTEKNGKCTINDLQAKIEDVGIYNFVFTIDDFIKEIEIMVIPQDIEQNAIVRTSAEFVYALENNLPVYLANDIILDNENVITSSYSNTISSLGSTLCTITLNSTLIETLQNEAKISNVNILLPNTIDVQGYIAKNSFGIIENINITNEAVDLSNDSTLICCNNYGTISGISTKLDIQAYNFDFATICYMNQGLIKKCTLDLNISGSSNISGVTYMNDISNKEIFPTIDDIVIDIVINYSGNDSTYSACGILCSAGGRVSSSTSHTILSNITLNFSYNASNVSNIYVVAKTMSSSHEMHDCNIFVNERDNVLNIIQTLKYLSSSYQTDNKLTFLQ